MPEVILYLGLFIVGISITLVISPIVIKLGSRWGILDYPDDRKVHKTPIPRVGGIVIYASFGAASFGGILLVDRLRLSFMQNWPFWGSLALGATMVFVLGLLDDIRRMPIWSKLAIEFGAAGLMMIVGGLRIETVGNPFGGTIELGWLWVPATALWIVGVTNAFNLIDGLDGLAGGIGFISTITILIVALLFGGAPLVVMVTALLAGSLLGFLKFNFYPARIFLGDCGSLFIGFVLAVMSLIGALKTTTALAVLVPVLIVGVPLFDTLSAMIRRLGRKPLPETQIHPKALGALFVGDKEHIHHALMENGYSHTKAVLRLYALSGLLAIFAIIATLVGNTAVSLGLMIAGGISFFLVQRSGGIKIGRTSGHTDETISPSSGHKELR